MNTKFGKKALQCKNSHNCKNVCPIIAGSFSFPPADDGDIDSAEFRMTVRVPVTDRSLQGILQVIPLQLLSYHMGVALGRSIDNPRQNANRNTAVGKHRVAAS